MSHPLKAQSGSSSSSSPWLTTRQAADLLGWRTTKPVAARCKDGRLQGAVLVGRFWRVPRSEVEKLLAPEPSDNHVLAEAVINSAVRRLPWW